MEEVMAKKGQSKELVRAEEARPISIFKAMERELEDFWRRPLWSPLFPRLRPGLGIEEMMEVRPSVDVFIEGDSVVVKAELPGMKKEDIDIKLTGSTITISGEKEKEEKVEKKNYYRVERSYGSFTRTLSLPSEVESDKAKAQFKNGILEIRIPKTEEAKKKEKKIIIE